MMLFPGLKNGLLGEMSDKNAVAEPGLGTTQQEVLDQAVRRFRRERPALIKLCLKPSHADVRQYAAAWIRREYQRIMAERDHDFLVPSLSPHRATQPAPARHANLGVGAPADHMLVIAR